MNSEVCFDAHLRAICMVFANTSVLWRCAATREFIILNKGHMRPPRVEEAFASHAQPWAQNFHPIFVPSPRVSVCLYFQAA